MWTYATVVIFSIIGYCVFFYYFMWYNKMVNMSEQAILRRYKNKEDRWIPYSETREKRYFCPNCNQPCTKEEHEHGFCLDCDQLELFNDFEGGD